MLSKAYFIQIIDQSSVTQELIYVLQIDFYLPF